MSVLPFFASMSSQASVFLGKGMAAQTELLRSPIFKWFCYKLNNEVTMLIIFDPTLSRAALESQSDFLWWTPLDGYGLSLQKHRTCIEKYFANHNRKAENSQNLGKEWHFEQTKNCLLTHFFTTHHSPMWKTLGPLTIITYINVNMLLTSWYIWLSHNLHTTDKVHQLVLLVS